MKVLLTNCSINPVGSRGFLVPTPRKNPRFPANTRFHIKEFTQSHLLVKLEGCNSIFAIAKSDAKEILGYTLDEYQNVLSQKRKEGLSVLSKILVEIYKGPPNES
jgi:hypothetical protein